MRTKKYISIIGILMALVLLLGACSPKISYEEGVTEADNIVNTTAAEKVILVVSFGTSYNLSRSLTIGGIEAAITKAYPEYQVRRAFTSQIIIDKLAARDNLKIDSVTEAMERLVLDKVKEVIIQPTTIMTGYEYSDIIQEVMPFVDKFDSFKISKPVFYDNEDYETMVDILTSETKSNRKSDSALVFMGHGTEHEANSTYARFQEALISKGYDDYVIGTVESDPDIESVQQRLSDLGVTKVVLYPLMIEAGDHANNDMASDDEDSWKSILKEDGYNVSVVLEGLGQFSGVQDFFVKRVADAIQSEAIEKTDPEKPSGITAKDIDNGVYSIDVETGSSMFKVIDCTLNVMDDKMSAFITLSGTGYNKLYDGSKEQAEQDEQGQIDFILQDEKHAFEIDVQALDIELAFAALGTKSGNWFDQTLVFDSTTLAADESIEREIELEFSGGTGRTVVESPAVLFYKDSTAHARITWSSANYIYMIVENEKYLPVNAQGNSVFEIPIKLDEDMDIVGCTVAMSEPKEIEYVLHFDSSSIR